MIVGRTVSSIAGLTLSPALAIGVAVAQSSDASTEGVAFMIPQARLSSQATDRFLFMDDGTSAA